MFRYSPPSQQAIEIFTTSFVAQFDPTNRWVVLAKLIPWPKLAQIYYQHLNKDKGRRALDARITIGAMIIKHLLNLSDREAIAMIRENPYMQYFLGLKGYQSKQVFDASLFVSLRKRMGQTTFDAFTSVIIKQVKSIRPNGKGKKKSNQGHDQASVKGKETKEEKEAMVKQPAIKEASLSAAKGEEEKVREQEIGSSQVKGYLKSGEEHETSSQKASKQSRIGESQEEQGEGEVVESIQVREEKAKLKGKLKLDATVADIYISYPTDIDLVNKSREWSEKLVDKLYVAINWKQKPRTYRRLARKGYLAVIKKKKKSKKVIRRGLRLQLNCLARNLAYIDKMLAILSQEGYSLDKQDASYYQVIKQVYDQQVEMLKEKKHTCQDRIVSIDQPYVRPIVRGKSKSPVEFGPKLGLSLVEGYTRIETLSWSAYHEGEVDFKKSVERYYQLYGYYPQLVQVDRIYASRSNRQWAQEKGIRITAKPLGRPKKETQEVRAYSKGKLRKEHVERNAIEGKIGQGKQGYRLNQIRTKTQPTGESWISCVIFVMNLVSYMSQIKKQHNKKQGKYFLFYITLLVVKDKQQPYNLERDITNRSLAYAA